MLPSAKRVDDHLHSNPTLLTLALAPFHQFELAHIYSPPSYSHHCASPRCNAAACPLFCFHWNSEVTAESPIQWKVFVAQVCSWKFERKTFFDQFCHRRPSLERCLQVIGAHRFLHFLVHWSALYSHVVNPVKSWDSNLSDTVASPLWTWLATAPTMQQPRTNFPRPAETPSYMIYHVLIWTFPFCCDWPRPSLASIEETTYCCHKNLWIEYWTGLHLALKLSSSWWFPGNMWSHTLIYNFSNVLNLVLRAIAENKCTGKGVALLVDLISDLGLIILNQNNNLRLVSSI